MNIAVKGSPERVAELSEILSLAGLVFTTVENTKNIHASGFNVVFDLNFDEDQQSLADYMACPEDVFFLLSAVNKQLDAIIPGEIKPRTAGINALPTFLKRNTVEFCTYSDAFDASVFNVLGWSASQRVDSRVGMVSPRVVCMIINEAYYTLQEGTASRKDIDAGMKLGTAYPFGPFEWADNMGIKNVYNTLSALYDDTHDERYRICSKLKTEYLNTQI